MTKLLKSFNISTETAGFGKLFSNFSTTFTRLAAVVSLAGLTGCGDMFEPTLREICESHGHFCHDLNQDSQCRYEKAEIIRHRFNHKDAQDQAHKYGLLVKFEDYLTCIERVAHIEHKKVRDKEATRLKGVLTARKEIDRLSRETRHAADPYLSYYQWSRYGHKDALERFLLFSRTGKVKDPELLVNLASIQVKDDLDATVETLYRALSLYQSSEQVDNDIYATLVTIGLEQERFRLAYVWAAVMANYNDNISMQQPQSLAQQHDLPVAVLNAVSEEIIDHLDDGTFDADALKLYRL
ncbi:DUF2989 domain-containing protein [Alteromonas sp. ASW11-19]|uniref:DUF2989 domain-containing protein n=1 Tax=Alteromonas salexigens TaxID=2982530 RepID=A0ABT2VM07_9ALTE|nr:DUF2989 domain-containing protein [Alteromonas salexigens]MCU7554356.1 DUF2989 domain-containing protein [Alteromonas salexigens]